MANEGTEGVTDRKWLRVRENYRELEVKQKKKENETQNYIQLHTSNIDQNSAFNIIFIVVIARWDSLQYDMTSNDLSFFVSVVYDSLLFSC